MANIFIVITTTAIAIPINITTKGIVSVVAHLISVFMPGSTLSLITTKITRIAINLVNGAVTPINTSDTVRPHNGSRSNQHDCHYCHHHNHDHLLPGWYYALRPAVTNMAATFAIIINMTVSVRLYLVSVRLYAHHDCHFFHHHSHNNHDCRLSG